MYSFGQCDPGLDASCNITTGTPITFVFGFAGVGGTPIGPDIGAPEIPTLNGVGFGVLVLLLAAMGFIAVRRRMAA